MTYDILNYIGYYGPIIILIITILYFIYDYKNQRYSISNIILSKMTLLIILNTILNILLKEIIQEPRPNGERFLFNSNIRKNDFYGMPSGHAQQVAFITSFFINNAYYSMGFLPLSISFILISVLTIIQRYKFKAHTLKQLFIGTLLGIFMGSL